MPGETTQDTRELPTNAEQVEPSPTIEEVRDALWADVEQEVLVSEIAAEVDRMQDMGELRNTIRRSNQMLRHALQLTQDRLRDALIELALLRDTVLHAETRMAAGRATPVDTARAVLMGLLASNRAKGLGFRLNTRDDAVAETVLSELAGCDGHREVCLACCCSFPAALTRAEVLGDKFQWSVERPFELQRSDDGYCVYLDREARTCTIYGARPQVCRTYRCQGDRRIWADYDAQDLAHSLVETAAGPRVGNALLP